MERLIAILNSISELPQPLEQLLREIFTRTTVAQGEMLLRPGEVNNNLYFIERGLFHIFEPDGDFSITMQFNWEDQFLFASLATEFKEGIEALEDSVLWCLPREAWENLRRTQMDFLRHDYMILEREFALKRKSLGCVEQETDQERVRFLRDNFPTLVERLPLKYLTGLTQIPEPRLKNLLDSENAIRDTLRRRRRRPSGGR